MRDPSITSTSSAQADGQSCGQTEERRTIFAGAFMGGYASGSWREAVA
jgi:hypothetical protein